MQSTKVAKLYANACCGRTSFSRNFGAKAQPSSRTRYGSILEPPNLGSQRSLCVNSPATEKLTHDGIKSQAVSVVKKCRFNAYGCSKVAA
jgi:hypothetical protein